MENKSSNGWKFFALLFGALLAAVVGLYIYKQQNPDYDPWEEPWENSSSPVDLGLTDEDEDEDAADEEAEAAEAAAGTDAGVAGALESAGRELSGNRFSSACDSMRLPFMLKVLLRTTMWVLTICLPSIFR